MNSNNSNRLEALDAEIKELESSMQKGSEVEEEPTQSTAPSNLGSPGEEDVVTAGQEEREVHDLAYWKDRALVAERRFNTSKPKYDANIYAMRKENTSLRDKLLKTQKELNELNQSIKARENQKVTDRLADKETVDVLGENTASAIKEAIEIANKRAEAAEKRLEDLVASLEEKSIKDSVNSEYKRFLSALRKRVPDYEELNRDPDFIKYLNEPDIGTGILRITLLRRAENAQDSVRVASFFEDFKNISNVTNVNDSTNNRIAAEGIGTGMGTSEAQRGTIKASFINKFYNDVARGKYKGRYSKQKEIEDMIDAAFTNNSIILDK